MRVWNYSWVLYYCGQVAKCGGLNHGEFIKHESSQCSGPVQHLCLLTGRHGGLVTVRVFVLLTGRHGGLVTVRVFVPFGV